MKREHKPAAGEWGKGGRGEGGKGGGGRGTLVKRLPSNVGCGRSRLLAAAASLGNAMATARERWGEEQGGEVRKPHRSTWRSVSTHLLCLPNVPFLEHLIETVEDLVVYLIDEYRWII